MGAETGRKRCFPLLIGYSPESSCLRRMWWCLVVSGGVWVHSWRASQGLTYMWACEPSLLSGPPPLPGRLSVPFPYSLAHWNGIHNSLEFFSCQGELLPSHSCSDHMASALGPQKV